jgi:hypothetical protein
VDSTPVEVLARTTSKSLALNTLKANGKTVVESFPVNGPAFRFSLEMVIGTAPEGLLEGYPPGAVIRTP